MLSVHFIVSCTVIKVSVMFLVSVKDKTDFDFFIKIAKHFSLIYMIYRQNMHLPMTA